MSRNHTKRIRADPAASEAQLDASYLRGLANDLTIRAQSYERSHKPDVVRRAVSLRRTVEALHRAASRLELEIA